MMEAADGEWALTQDAGDAGGSIIEHVVMEPTVEENGRWQCPGVRAWAEGEPSL